MGAEASLTLYHHDDAASIAAIKAVLAEMERLKGVFSLYEPTSEISGLNRDGILLHASPEFIELLTVCRDIRSKTDGLFDPTMQPLFEFYADHYAKTPEAEPGADGLERVLKLVGLDKVSQTDETIRFDEPGMALSLNGIAQGYLTDHACAVLELHGFRQCLVNMGEYRALGNKPGDMGESTPWKIGIADALAPWQVLETVDVVDAAVATSSPSGAAFTGQGGRHHLLNPITGVSENHYLSVTVMAPTATTADGLSTALTLVAPDDVPAVLARFPQAKALLRTRDGNMVRLGL